MKIIELQADNFKRLRAVQIKPGDDPVIEIAGRNGQGKSSILDAIWVALIGKAKAPPKPVRTGEEEATIYLDLGELRVLRKFRDKDGKQTDTLKLTNAEGHIMPEPHRMLTALLGEIGFDPFAFATMKPDDQAEQLMELVPLPIDLDEFKAADTKDFTDRTDINREVTRLRGTLASIAIPADLPEKAPDRDDLLRQLTSAADTNSQNDREKLARQGVRQRIDQIRADSEAARKSAEDMRAEADRLQKEAAGRTADAVSGDAEAERLEAELAKLAKIPEPVDTAKLRDEIAEADRIMAGLDAKRRRDEIEKELNAKVAASEALTTALDERDKTRLAALAKAKMPVDGLSFGLNEKGQPVLLYDGVPFEQANMAVKIRASTAIAMAANPTLRVLRIENGALLDDEAMAILHEMAAAEDFQLWVEVVKPSEGGSGIVIEDGAIKGAAEPEGNQDDSKAKPKAKAEAEPGRQYLTAKFDPADERAYSYHNDGDPVKPGDQVLVPAGKGTGTRTVTVQEVGVAKPPFETKAISGKAPAAKDGELGL